MSKPQISIRVRIMAGDVRAMGPGKADLLQHIDKTGSISSGAKAMKMSYRRAWQLVEEMNSAFRAPLVETSAGGKGGGGAALTPMGREVLALYRDLEDAVQREAGARFAAFRKRLKS